MNRPPSSLIHPRGPSCPSYGTSATRTWIPDQTKRGRGGDVGKPGLSSRPPAAPLLQLLLLLLLVCVFLCLCTYTHSYIRMYGCMDVRQVGRRFLSKRTRPSIIVWRCDRDGGDKGGRRVDGNTSYIDRRRSGPTRRGVARTGGAGAVVGTS